MSKDNVISLAEARGGASHGDVVHYKGHAIKLKHRPTVNDFKWEVEATYVVPYEGIAARREAAIEAAKKHIDKMEARRKK